MQSSAHLLLKYLQAAQRPEFMAQKSIETPKKDFLNLSCSWKINLWKIIVNI